ncbi:hypothetical protein GGR53DRAFT_465706 [Hypoxylon sp. FL1150]|nr:hypothetical protein GGR53DRAFT_465706 [Hypoxylon sp. FL1150]
MSGHIIMPPVSRVIYTVPPPQNSRGPVRPQPSHPRPSPYPPTRPSNPEPLHAFPVAQPATIVRPATVLQPVTPAAVVQPATILREATILKPVAPAVPVTNLTPRTPRPNPRPNPPPPPPPVTHPTAFQQPVPGGPQTRVIYTVPPPFTQYGQPPTCPRPNPRNPTPKKPADALLLRRVA